MNGGSQKRDWQFHFVVTFVDRSLVYHLTIVQRFHLGIVKVPSICNQICSNTVEICVTRFVVFWVAGNTHNQKVRTMAESPEVSAGTVAEYRVEFTYTSGAAITDGSLSHEAVSLRLSDRAIA